MSQVNILPACFAVARTNIDHDVARQRCIPLLAAGWQAADILRLLESESIALSSRTFYRLLPIWKAHPEAQCVTQTLRDTQSQAIALLCQSGECENDEDIALTLFAEGIRISARMVRTLRYEQGLQYHKHDPEEQAAEFQRCKELVWTALHEGTPRQYGRGLMETHLEKEYDFRPRQQHLQEVLRVIWQHLGVPRTLGPLKVKHPRVYADYHAPDYMWSIDGHDKLGRYGIEIYGCIDAHSRCIKYLYVGTTNKTQVAVGKMYLSAIRQEMWCPRWVRADRGNEVPFLGDIHLHLYRQYQANLHTAAASNFDPLQIESGQCLLYGPSYANQRIEQLWRRLILAQTLPWIAYFGWLVKEQLFDDSQVDKVCVAYIFLPIIRSEIFKWIRNHNSKCIRRQKNAKYYGQMHVAGAPEDIYADKAGRRSGIDAEERYGFPPDMAVIQYWMDQLESFGKLNRADMYRPLC